MNNLQGAARLPLSQKLEDVDPAAGWQNPVVDSAKRNQEGFQAKRRIIAYSLDMSSAGRINVGALRKTCPVVALPGQEPD